MEKKTQQDLEKAKDLFHDGRLLEAYNILRRYFDRLPFKPELAHAECIGMFARCLMELGKEWELKFYMTELEKLYRNQWTPEIGYQLGYIYSNSEEVSQQKAAKELLEEVIKRSSVKSLQDKARMSLARYYDGEDPDFAAMTSLIEGIQEPIEESLRPLVAVWKAKLKRDMGHWEESEKILNNLLQGLTLKKNWYAFFSAKNTQTFLFLKMKRVEEARRNHELLKNLFKSYNFKSIHKHLRYLEQEINHSGALSPVLVEEEVEGVKLVHEGRTLVIKGKCHAEKILLTLLKKRLITKQQVSKILFKRDYDSSEDDKLIYYHIHNLRKILGDLGLPADAVVAESGGYRFIPEVQVPEVNL